MENLFAKDFPGLFTTYGEYIVHLQKLYEVHLLVVAIRVLQLHIFANQNKSW